MAIKYNVSKDLFGFPVMTVYDVPVYEVDNKTYNFENIIYTLDKEYTEQEYKTRAHRVIINRVTDIIIKMTNARYNTLKRAYNINNEYKLEACARLKKSIQYLRGFNDKMIGFVEFIESQMINDLVDICPASESVFYINYARQINMLNHFIKRVRE